MDEPRDVLRKGLAQGGINIEATRIVWDEDMVLVVSRDLDKVQESFDEALESGGWVLIDANDGQKVSVNPSQVRYLERVESNPRRGQQ